jgi:osmotically-inducible protein OsmY
MTNRRRVSTLLLALALLGPLLSGCAKANGPVRAGAVDDAILTTRVKTVFINDPVIGDARIDVDTFKGVVTLSGRVTNKEQEAKAIELARTIRGVTDVKSSLQIQP